MAKARCSSSTCRCSGRPRTWGGLTASPSCIQRPAFRSADPFDGPTRTASMAPSCDAGRCMPPTPFRPPVRAAGFQLKRSPLAWPPRCAETGGPMHHLKPLSVLLLALTLGACATAPAVRSELPVERVVIYRNGVAYFERQGETRATELTFKVRPDHVGDFLASLAVMEHGGSSVRSASFPLKTRTAQPITFDEDGEPIPVPEDTSLVDVTLALDGQRRTLTVGYIAEQPVWKPSYRLVFENGKPT